LYADTITVTNTNDSGPGSLRQALVDANDGDTITFAVTGTIGLASGELLVNKSITISGPGAESLAVNGNATSRVFHIGLSKTVTISGLTVTNGNASNQPALDGGGIYNDHATLTVSNCTISNNAHTYTKTYSYTKITSGFASASDTPMKKRSELQPPLSLLSSVEKFC